MRKKIKDVVLGALLAALSFISMYLIQIPIFRQAPYLQYDPSEIFSLFAAFFISPSMGVLVTLVKVILFFLTKSESGPIGSLMNFLAVSPFVFFAGVFYKKMKNLLFPLNFLFPIIIGTIIRILVMIPANLIFVPIYWGLSIQATWIYIWSINVWFNIVVSVINGGVFLILSFVLSKASILKKELVNVKR